MIFKKTPYQGIIAQPPCTALLCCWSRRSMCVVAMTACPAAWQYSMGEADNKIGQPRAAARPAPPPAMQASEK